MRCLGLQLTEVQVNKEFEMFVKGKKREYNVAFEYIFELTW